MIGRRTVEFADAPLAVGTRVPRFSWELLLPGRGRRQTAYRILVATEAERLRAGNADLWDSGMVESSQSILVPYAGCELRSNIDCYWSVRIWDERGRASDFSEPSYFGTAFFEQTDWRAKWIGMGSADEPVPQPDEIPRLMEGGDGAKKVELKAEALPRQIAAFEPDMHSPQMRAEFAIDRGVRRARAFICGLGLFELRLNGAKVGEDVLATPRTDFRKRVYYSVYDITDHLQLGANALGLLLGNGWYNGQKTYWYWQMPWFGSPRAIAQLEIEFEDGARKRIVSDESWRGASSPITFNCIYDGEDYDARLEREGWDGPGFDASGWTNVNVVPGPGGRLVALDHPPTGVTDTVRPVSMRSPAPGMFVYDMGTVMTGWARLRVRGGVRGETITLRYAELQQEDGQIDPSTAGGARQAETYVMKGAETELYEPRFTYHGFRYVELTGYPGVPDLDALEGRFVGQGVTRTGHFECGHELINKIHRCTVQSQRCNLQMGVPTDDTQRAERLGWAGDAWSYAHEALYNFDMPRFFAKWIADFRDQQDQETGLVSYICPLPAIKEDLVWSAAFVLIPWWQYVQCGDRRILEQNYPYLQKYMMYLERVGERELPALPPEGVRKALVPSCTERFPEECDRGFLQRSRFGDHLATNEGSSGFGKDQPRSMATAFYAFDAIIMARIAETVGKEEDARAYRTLANKIKEAYNEAFFDANLGHYDIGCQSAQALALAFDLVPEEYRERVASYFASSVNFRQRRLTTGYAATKWAIEALAQAGRHDIIWRRATATDYPSWGYMLRGDKTTITENWHGAASQCHTTLGAAIDEWFYWGLAGIRTDPDAPGFERIVIKPYLPEGLEWVYASLDTPRGQIVSSWRREEGRAVLTVAVPANSAAIVRIPSDRSETITEEGVPVADAKGVTHREAADGETRVEIGSGVYRFAFPCSPTT